MAARGAWVCDVGMVTPIGDCADQTVTSFRAGISRYAESSIINRNDDPITMALLPEDVIPPLEPSLASALKMTARRRRMLRLGSMALAEASKARTLVDVPILLGVPEPLPDREPPVGSEYLDQLKIQTGLEFDRARSETFATGRAAGLQAVEKALELLDRDTDFVIVGGVESHLDLHLLAKLDADGRLLADGVMDGFCPGEGAAFLLLASARLSPENRPGSLAFVTPPGLADETGHRYSDEPYRGDGLAEAVAGAIENADTAPMVTIFSSMNGENIHAKEWGVAFLRNSSSIDDSFRIEHPADLFGDVGAATMPMLTGLASHGIASKDVSAPCLVCCSSEHELRGAICLTADGNGAT